nr:hypothetical protein [Providencia sp. wls1949]
MINGYGVGWRPSRQISGRLGVFNCYQVPSKTALIAGTVVPMTSWVLATTGKVADITLLSPTSDDRSAVASQPV